MAARLNGLLNRKNGRHVAFCVSCNSGLVPMGSTGYSSGLGSSLGLVAVAGGYHPPHPTTTGPGEANGLFTH